jgi:hypothetical protein
MVERVQISTVADAAISELCEAIRLTVEYVGTTMLPPIEGWSWYDALVKYAPETATMLKEERYRGPSS